MVFTTHFGLHSQTNRLFEAASHESLHWTKDGILTLYDALFQRTCAQEAPDNDSLNYNSHRKPVRFQIWAIPASLAVTKGILVSFFSSAYWYA